MAFVGHGDEQAAIKVMDSCYRKQKQTMNKMVEQLSNQADVQVANGDKVLFVRMANEDREYGGLAANKLKTIYHRPIIVLRDADNTNWSGSIRSDCDALSKINASGLASCRGHEKAAGIFIKKSRLAQFRKWANEQDWGDVGVRQVACQIDKDNITIELCRQLDKYTYLWGQDLPTPQFYTEFVIGADEPCLCGKQHNTFKYGPFLKFRCQQSEIDMLDTNKPKKVKAIIELSVNEYNGNQYPQAMIVDWEIDIASEPVFDWDSLFN